MSVLLKTIQEALGITTDEIKRVEQAMPQSVFKRYVEYKIEKVAFERATNNLSKTVEDINFERGVQEGLNIAKGILNRPAK